MKIMKVLKVVLVVLTLCVAMSNFAYAYDYSGTITTLDTHTGDGTLNTKATSIVGAIISVLRIVATGVAIIMIIAVAMKYMSSAPGDRAEIKKHAVIYVVGAIVLFGASGILTIIQNFAKSI